MKRKRICLELDAERMCDRLHPSSRVRGDSLRRGEQGYTLVALLALMTLMALFLTAAAPNIRHQAQREREKEAIFRGEEVAEAIRRYAQAHNGALPTSMDQLLEGIPRGVKKVQILRSQAALDPLSSSGEWRLIRPNDPLFLEFQRALTVYAGGRLPIPTDPFLRQLQQRYAVQLTSILDTGSVEKAPGGEDDSPNSPGPFIGVVSRSRRNSIITYYGIERHDRWVFTPLFR
ncbi:MAG TPA: hypothetical protein VD966_05170 [Pyrinomonadaceae bacterium]|nr:hypothetical protein [Pyrinomonadaceae bacterium]